MVLIYYTVSGGGSPALLIHGHASSGAMWERVITAYLGRYYRCYAIDLPGHGASAKPGLDWYNLENFTGVVSDFCDRLRLEKILLVGHSLGGLISLNLSLNRPSLADRLILVAPPVNGRCLAYLDPLLHLEGLVRRHLAERLVRLYSRHTWLAIPGGLNIYAQPRMLWSETFRRDRADMARCTAQALFGSYRAVRRADISPRLATLQPPTLVITGDRDRVIPPSQAHLVAAQAPSAKLVVIPQAGHLPLDEQPELFDKAVKEFLGVLTFPRRDMV